MSELNIFLSALQSAFADSVAKAVASATAPLMERIAALEKNEEYLTRRITALENNPAIGVDTTLEKRVAVLEGAPSVLAAQYTPISNEQFKAMLEEWGIGRLAQRIAALETKLTEADLFTRTTAITVDEAKMVEALNSQEWFWHKVAGFVTNNSEITANDLEVVKDRIAALESGPSAIVEEQRGIDDELMRVKQRIDALESETQGENRYLNRDEVNELIAEAIDDHLGTYDHDEYDNHLGDDDKHFDGDIEDAVRDALNGTSVTLSF